jgi:hypothetical protein
MRFKISAQRDQYDFTPEAPCPCPQIYFDPILLERVRTFPNVSVRYNAALQSFRQDHAGVTAAITDLTTGNTETLRARYLVGCDGPAGLVRGALGIRLEGPGVVAISVNIFFRSAELASLHDKGWARFYRLIDESGCWSELIPIDGKELWRLTVFDEPASSSEPEELLRKMAGGDFPHQTLNVSKWERRDFVAQSYGRGRVLIAGDAAHECSPTGGIGMHMGLEEVVNLGWKLAAMIEGWGGAALIPSYEIERRPIARRNVEFATRSFRAIAGIPGWPVAGEWRADTSWLSVPEHLKFQYCYEGSPICVPDGTPAPESEPSRFAPTTRPGARAPHAWLRDGGSMIDLFGDGFVLLQLGERRPAGAAAAAARACGVPLREIAVPDPAIAELYERSLVLVRPDGHVAWRGDVGPADPLAIINRVRGAAALEAAEPPSPAPAVLEDR